MLRACNLALLLLALTRTSAVPRSQEPTAGKYPPGLIVTYVAKGSPADMAGLKPGDLLLSFDGKPTRFESQLSPFRDKALWDGKKMAVLVIRRGADTRTFNLTLWQGLGFDDRPPLPATAQTIYDEAIALPKAQSAGILAKLQLASEEAGKQGDDRAAAWLWLQVFNHTVDRSKDEHDALNALLERAQRAGDELLGVVSLTSLGNAALSRGTLAEADAYYKRALEIVERLTPDSLDLERLLDNVGNVSFSRGNLPEAEAFFKRGYAIVDRLAPDSLDMARSLINLGNVAYNHGKLDEAESDFKRTLAIRERYVPDSLDLAKALANLGDVAFTRGKLAQAEEYFKRDFAITERLAPDSLDMARSLTNLGSAAETRGNLDEAEAYYSRDLAIVERVAPDSLILALSISNVGTAEYRRGKLEEAEKQYRRAFSIQEVLAPDSLEVSRSLNNLGVVARDRGNLDEAEAVNNRAMAIKERLAPGSLDLATTLTNLGNIAAARGKLDDAEVFDKRALEIQGRLAPNSLDVAASLNNLGIVEEMRGKLDEAEQYHKRALIIQDRLAPDSLEPAASLHNLGNVSEDRGKLIEAEGYYKRDLAITERLAPDSLNLATTLHSLGIVAHDRGNLDEAEAYYRRALTIRERLAPDSLDMAASLHNLAVVANARGNVQQGDEYSKRDLVITERLAPGSLALATSLTNRGLVAEAHGNLDEAEALYKRAWLIVQRQGAKVYGDSGRQEYGKSKAVYASNMLNVQLKLHRPEAAFATLEEGRAQALIEVMAERGITEKVSPPLVWRAYHASEIAHNMAYKDSDRAAAAVNKSKALLGALKEQKADEASLLEKQRVVDEAEKQFEQTRTEEGSARAEMEIRWSDVLRAAKSALPPAINPDQARQRIAPGTLLLEFSARGNDVTLFAATSVSVQAYTLTAKREELEAKVKFIRRYVARDTDDRGPVLASDPDIEQDALRTLFQKLFPPNVQKAIQNSQHIVISPDDFLWDLPFAALITSTTGGLNYMGLQKPLSYAQSLTVLLTPGPSSTGSGIGALVIGNPAYSAEVRKGLLAREHSKPTAPNVTPLGVKLASARRDGELGMMTPDGAAPPQLPFAEQEAKKVSALYAHTAAHIGIEPTEAWFRLRAPDAKVIHLATHGFLNAYSPESSGVLLAVPEKFPPAGQYDNDGALQAWEVWSLKLKADLVVLSACETGRGAKVMGEGLIGLTRAFQYAGAKTIVSSQWRVNDRSTAALMIAFHKHLLASADRDEALRLAMVEVANSKEPGWSAPYHWAAFLMVGETGKMWFP